MLERELIVKAKLNGTLARTQSWLFTSKSEMDQSSKETRPYGQLTPTRIKGN